MNFKYIALVLFTLLPMVSFCNEVEKQIKELKEAQIAKSQELLDVIKQLKKQAEALWSGKDVVQKYWDTETKEDLIEVIDELTSCFYSGKKIDEIFEKRPLNRGYDITVRVYLMQVIALRFLYEQVVLRYNGLVNELITINAELVHLQGGEVYEYK